MKGRKVILGYMILVSPLKPKILQQSIPTIAKKKNIHFYLLVNKKF
jgi:hypothetical protein